MSYVLLSFGSKDFIIIFIIIIIIIIIGYEPVPRGTPGFIPWRVGRVTERGFLLSESAYFLCRAALARHALQA